MRAGEIRRKRIAGSEPLCAALFASGAYPPPHIKKLKLAAKALTDAGHAVFWSAGTSTAMHTRLKHWAVKAGIPLSDSIAPGKLYLARPYSRREENRLTAEQFERFDIFIAPAHERTNWAVGLGLPMFILEPQIGPYAPLNAHIAQSKGTAELLTTDADCRNLPDRLTKLRTSGVLSAMAEAGSRPDRINGFANAADFVCSL
jgi:hypothetical protein